MKMLYFLFVLILSSAFSFGQASFILTGQTADMIFTDYVPDFSLAAPLSGASNYMSDSVYIDINKDGINDFQFKINSSSSPASSVFTYSLKALNNNLVLITLSQFKKYMQGSFMVDDTSMHVVGKRSLYGDSIFNTKNPMWSGGQITLSSSLYIAGTSASLRDTTTPSGSAVYYSLKVIAGTDTLLGYLHVSTQNALMDFACQGSTSTYVISSVEDTMDKGIELYPNPFTNYIKIKSDESVNYQITDLQGRELARGAALNPIPTNDLPNGVYLLFLRTSKSGVFKRMIKADY